MEWYESDGAEMLAEVGRLRTYATQFHCRINPSSRIAAFERLVQSDKNDQERLAHGARDLYELVYICEKIAPACPDKLKAALPVLLSGSSLPSLEGRKQKPRSLQFEYLIAAELVNAGFEVALEEPDLVFIHRGETLGLAAKRPISRKQVVRRVKEGADQLAPRSDQGGIIAVCLDRMLQDGGADLVARGERAVDDALRTLVLEEFRPFWEETRAVIAPTRISGIMLSLTVVGCVQDDPTHAGVNVWMAREDGLVEETELVKSIVRALAESR